MLTIIQSPLKHILGICANFILHSITLLVLLRLFLLLKLALIQKHQLIIYFLWKFPWTDLLHIIFEKLCQRNHSSKYQLLSNCHLNNKYFRVHVKRKLTKTFLVSFSTTKYIYYSFILFTQIEFLNSFFYF